jgi:hypothetical protein
MESETFNIILKMYFKNYGFSLKSVYLRRGFWRTSHCCSTDDVHWHSEMEKYSTAFKITYPATTLTYATSREMVIYRLGVYYSTVVTLCKHVSQVLSNSSFNAFTGYNGRKGQSCKRYQNPLPLHINPLLSFEGSWACTLLVDISCFKAVNVDR